MVGKAHTGSLESGLKHRKNKPALFVEYRDINLLLGWVENAVTDIVMGVDALDIDTKVAVLKALNKYWWLQNDLFARHYIDEGEAPGDARAAKSVSVLSSDTVRAAIVASLSTFVLLGAFWRFTK
jgi:hypothetical protein